MEIFKIQIDAAGQMALVYNKDRSSMGEFPVSEELLDIMDGQPKKFFFCEPHDDRNPIQIIKEAPTQSW